MRQNNSQQESEPKTFEEIYSEAAEDAAMVSGKSWARFIEFIRGWERDAYDDMIGNESKSMAWSFQNRWKQREALLRGSIAWADNAVKTRDQMIEELKQELETV